MTSLLKFLKSPGGESYVEMTVLSGECTNVNVDCIHGREVDGQGIAIGISNLYLSHLKGTIYQLWPGAGRQIRERVIIFCCITGGGSLLFRVLLGGRVLPGGGSFETSLYPHRENN